MSDGYRIFESNYDFWEEQEMTEAEYDAQEREKSECFDEGFQQGRADREAEIVSIIEQMKETASAMLWTEREVACEKILEQIKENRNE